MSKKISQPTTKDISSLILLGFIWSTSFVILRYLAPYLTPSEVSFFRVFFGALALIPIIMYQRLSWKLPNKKDLTNIILFSIVGITIPFILFNKAAESVNGGILSLINSTGPFWGLLISHFFSKDDKITRQKLIGVIIGFIGLLILLWDSLESPNSSLSGNMLAMSALLMITSSSILMRRAGHINPLIFVNYSFILSGISLFLITAFSTAGFSYENHTSKILVILILLGALPTAFAWSLRFFLINKVGYSFVSSVGYLIPIFGIIMSYLILGETINKLVFLSLITVLFGLYVSTYKKK